MNMLAEGENILDLIPQRPPMVMISKLLYCDPLKTTTGFIVEPDNLFLHDGHFSEPGLIENIAQTAAVRNGWLSASKSGSKTNVPIGVIGGIRNFKLNFLPEVNTELTTEIEVIGEYFNASSVFGKVEVNGEIAAQCELKIFTQEQD
jgi:predicted hotdog family 3-hydroxylacyl-ACP dehydratase